MKAETQILNNYLGLLDTLNPGMKLKLIEKLSKSIKNNKSSNGERIEKAFGAWKDSRNSKEIITEIRNSRNFNRKIEKF